MIDLIVEPRVTKKWDEFCRDAPPYSIALDGYVDGPPAYDPDGHHENFDHHNGVSRLATRSTSGQVYLAIKQGLFEEDGFCVKGEPTAHNYINDCDNDTTLAKWLLDNHERIEGERSEPLINRLVSAEDFLDTTGGAYPFPPTLALMHELAWNFEPFTIVRHDISNMSAGEMRNVVDAVCSRISQYSVGRGGKADVDTTFETLHKGRGWTMLNEIGPYARTGLYHSGIRAYITVKHDKEPYVYTIGKLSHYSRFPIGVLYDHLNQVEGISADANDRWSGSNIIGGSPRKCGSRISPPQLACITDEFMKRRG